MSKPSKISALLDLIRFDKPVGTLLLLWPTLWALWLASDGMPDYRLLAIFIVGTFLMRSAGCIVNDMADRNVDGAVARTNTRPLVTGTVTVNEAMALFVVLCLMAFALVLLTNTLTILLSFAAVALAATYPFMKRFTHLPQVVLGAAFSWGVPMAFAAQLNELPPELWLIYTANVLWTVIYDTQYAMVDRDDDIKAGIKSTAVLFGDSDCFIIGCLQVLCIVTLYLAGLRFELDIAYKISVALAAALFLYHQFLIKDRDPARCFQAFKNNNWVGAVLFVGIAANYLG